MNVAWIFFGGHLKIELYLRVLCILGSFLKVNVQNGGYFLGVAKISNIFWRCSKFLILFWMNGRCWARAYV